MAEDNVSDSELNITSEMISNLANMIKNGNAFSSSNNFTHANSSSFEDNNDASSENTSSNNIFNNFDFETILKIKSIMENLNKNDDPRSRLLYSLKPYLRKSRQGKIDQYVNLFKIAQVSNLFKNDKGDDI